MSNWLGVTIHSWELASFTLNQEALCCSQWLKAFAVTQSHSLGLLPEPAWVYVLSLVKKFVSRLFWFCRYLFIWFVFNSLLNGEGTNLVIVGLLYTQDLDSNFSLWENHKTSPRLFLSCPTGHKQLIVTDTILPQLIVTDTILRLRFVCSILSISFLALFLDSKLIVNFCGWDFE